MKITLALLLVAFIFPANNNNGTSVFIAPVAPEFEIISVFGMRTHPVLDMEHFHDGIDFKTPENTPVLAAADGMILFAGETELDGIQIIISHSDGFESIYSNLASAEIKVGDDIKQGQNIATSGKSGYTHQSFLHFSLKKNGEFVDPEEFISPK